MAKPRQSSSGFTLLEVLLALAVALMVVAAGVPLLGDSLDEARTAMAARYLESRIMDARMQALRRSAAVALRFEQQGDDYCFAEYGDANGNGVRTAEINSGIDVELRPRQVLAESFPGVAFGLNAGVPDIDGAASSSASDGVRIGSSRLLSLSPDGTATSGTLYVHGRRGQYAVRIMGATGRTRVLRYDAGNGEWISR